MVHEKKGVYGAEEREKKTLFPQITKLTLFYMKIVGQLKKGVQVLIIYLLLLFSVADEYRMKGPHGYFLLSWVSSTLFLLFFCFGLLLTHNFCSCFDVIYPNK